MRVVYWLGAVVLVACGRLGFDATIARDDANGTGEDAAADDGSVGDSIGGDAAPTGTPAVSGVGYEHGANQAGLTYAMAVPAGTNRALLVSVQVSSMCGDGGVSAVSSVTYGGTALALVASVVGTPCDAASTRSTQWLLLAPPVGAANVVVTLSATATAVHSGAVALDNVDQTQPVRLSRTATANGLASSLSIPSVAHDLVVNLIGDGDHILSTGQTEGYIDNASGTSTLDNSGISTAPGAANVTMTWTFGLSDEWQTISSSIRPAT